MPIRVRDDEASVATDDASSNAVGLIKKYQSERFYSETEWRWPQDRYQYGAEGNGR